MNACELAYSRANAFICGALFFNPFCGSRSLSSDSSTCATARFQYSRGQTHAKSSLNCPDNVRSRTSSESDFLKAGARSGRPNKQFVKSVTMIMRNVHVGAR